MQRQTHTIPRAAVTRILVNAGAKRVSEEASNAFAEVLEQIAKDIGSAANDIAKHTGRKTVQDVDIKLAKDQKFGR
jgi:DNA-binding protein